MLSYQRSLAGFVREYFTLFLLLIVGLYILILFSPVNGRYLAIIFNVIVFAFFLYSLLFKPFSAKIVNGEVLNFKTLVWNYEIPIGNIKRLKESGLIYVKHSYFPFGIINIRKNFLYDEDKETKAFLETVEKLINKNSE